MDEGELAFVATMRDEATRQARAIRSELDRNGGSTKAIEVPVRAKAETRKARAEIKALEKSLKDTRVDLELTTTQARKRLAELQSEIAKTKARVGVDLDTAEAEARLKALAAERDEVKVAVDLNTAQARARILALKTELKALRDETVNIDVKGAGTLTEASRGASTLLTAVLVLGPAIIPILAAITLATGGVAAGFVAAAGAAGILGAAVIGQTVRMTEAHKEVSTLTDKLEDQRGEIDQLRQTLKGQTKGTDEYKATLKKLGTAQDKAKVTARELRQEQAKFDRTYGPAAKGLDRVKKAWDGFLKATRPQTLGLMGDGLNAVADVLPMVAPLANAAAGAVRQLIGEFRAWAKGPEAQALLDFFEKEGPPAIVSFGHIAGNILVGVLNLLKAFAPDIDSVVGGLERMTARFREWSAGLDQNEGFQSFLEYARDALPQVGAFLLSLVHIAVALAQAWAPFGTVILAGVTGLLNLVSSLPTPVVQAFTVAVGGLLLMLKAWQVGVFAVTAAQRVATVATVAWAAANQAAAFTFGTTTGRLVGVAAGIGGVALAAKEGGGAMSILGGAASGALAGGALGSFFPGAGTAVGAIIGGLVGLGAGMLTAGENTKQAGGDARAAVGDWRSLASTLDDVSAATSRATRAMVLDHLNRAKVLTTTRELGFSDRQVVSAVTQQGAARKALVGTLQAQYAATKRSYDQIKGQPNTTKAIIDQKAEARARMSNIDAVLKELGAVNRAVKEKRHEIAVTREFTGAVKSLPPRVQTELKINGLDGTRKNIVDIQRMYHLVPKDIRTLIRESGGTPTKKMVERIIAEAKRLGNLKPNVPLKATDHVSGVVRGAEAAVGRLDGKHATVTLTTNKIINTITHLIPGHKGYHGGTVTRRGIIQRFAGGGMVDGPGGYRDSVLALLAPTEEVIPNDRGQADAYRSDRAAGRIPAYAKGGKVRKAGKAAGKRARAQAAVVHNLTLLFDKAGADKAAGAIDAVNKRLDTYYGKNKKAAAAAKKSLADEYVALKNNAKARDVIVAKINAAKDAGKAATEAALQSLDVTSIERINDAPMTAGFIQQGLEARVKALAKFQADLATLRRRGVDKALVGELAQKGVEAGGEYAAALASATSGQLAAVNKAEKDIRAQAAKIGADTTTGLAAGLSSQLKAIDAAGTRLANALLKAVRRRLGIKSPSREFYRDGVMSVAGQINAIRDETPAAEAQAAALAARVQAAATPALGELVNLANASVRLAPSVVRVSETLVIRHEVTSPDGSVTKLTADEIAEILAKDPRATAALERVLRPFRARKGQTTITPSR